MKEVNEKRIKVNYDIDNVYNDIFVKNDTLKLYDKTISDLQKAVDLEKSYEKDLEEKIKQMKELLHEEQIQRDELK